jgi:hypothetical protein
MIPLGKTGKQVSLAELSRMKVRDYEALSGHKLKLVDKLGFKLAQRELKRTINPDGSFNQKKLEALNKKMAAGPATEQSHHYLKLFILFLIISVVLGIIGLFVPFFWILSALAWIGTVIFFILWLISLSGAM